MAKCSKATDGTVLYTCPGCGRNHGLNVEPENGRPQWGWNGDEERPTFTPSVLCRFGRDGAQVCHSYVTDGRAQFLSDCTHDHAGETMDLPEWA